MKRLLVLFAVLAAFSLFIAGCGGSGGGGSSKDSQPDPKKAGSQVSPDLKSKMMKK